MALLLNNYVRYHFCSQQKQKPERIKSKTHFQNTFKISGNEFYNGLVLLWVCLRDNEL